MHAYNNSHNGERAGPQLALPDTQRDGMYPWRQLLILGAMGVVFATVGFVVGLIFCMVVLQLARGGRSPAYRDLVRRHPLVRLLSALCVIACGVVMAVLAHGLAG
jgi:hypothetical protein